MADWGALWAVWPGEGAIWTKYFPSPGGITVLGQGNPTRAQTGTEGHRGTYSACQGDCSAPRSLTRSLPCPALNLTEAFRRKRHRGSGLGAKAGATSQTRGERKGLSWQSPASPTRTLQPRTSDLTLRADARRAPHAPKSWEVIPPAKVGSRCLNWY